MHIPEDLLLSANESQNGPGPGLSAVIERQNVANHVRYSRGLIFDDLFEFPCQSVSTVFIQMPSYYITMSVVHIFGGRAELTSVEQKVKFSK